MSGQAIRVGFIGLGTIGEPMAANLLAKGFPLAVFDLDQSRTALLTARGARGRGTPAAVAAGADLVVTMVPEPADVLKAALEPGGIIEGLRPGGLYVDMSTSDPVVTRRIGAAMAARGIRMVDAPVARTVENARAGTLSIMTGGEPADVEAAMPVLRAMGDTFTYCGPLGNAHALKLVNNYVAAGVMSLLCEALAMGVKAGLRLETIIELVQGTYAGTRQLGEVFPRKPLRGDFTPGFFTRLSRKDQRLALGLARAMGVDAPVGRGVLEALESACEAGFATDDFSSVLRVREREAGIEVRLGPPVG